jgi:tRNA A37 methylthiotransferase MiaB
MPTNENILIHRLLSVLTDLNNSLDAEAAELIIHDICKVTGKTQNEVAAMLNEVSTQEY